MALNVGNIVATLSLNISNFMSSLKQASSAATNMSSNLNQAFNGANGGIQKANNSLNKLSGDMKDFNRIVSGIVMSQMFYQGVHAIEDASSALFKFMGDMQKAQVSLQYFVGGGPQMANKFLYNMQDFAASTPFNTQDSTRLSIQLMNAGFKPENVRGVMTTLSDAASATGGTQEQLDRIVLALTQIQAKGKMAGQEMMQLADANIPIYTILQQKLGLTAKEMSNLGKLQVPANAAITAILQGLQERYKGAGAQLAETIPGMWETIKDDMMIAGNTLFNNAYGGIGNFIRSIRDTLDNARKILASSGVGGLFQHFIPPELQQSVRNITASIISMGHSFSILFEALGPPVKLLAGTFTEVLGVVMPLIAGVMNFVAKLANTMTQTSPVVRVLVAAIMGLVVANMAGNALMFLWSITRMGTMCATVAEAVAILTRAIKLLFLTASKNPVVGIVMLIAAALLYLATSSATVTSWLDKVSSKLASFMGLNTNLFKSQDNTGMDKWIKDYNKQLEGMNKSLADTGKNVEAAGNKAKKAGKEVKDKFIASFDEVFQVPDKLNQALAAAGDGLDGLAAKVPNIPLPTIQLPKPPTDASSKDTFDNPVPVGKSNGNDKGDSGDKGPKPPDTGAFAIAVEAIERILSNAKSYITNWVGETVPVIEGWGVKAGQAVTSWATNTAKSIRDWATDTARSIHDLPDEALNALIKGLQDTNTVIGNWVVTSYNAIKQWGLDTSGAIASWITETAASFGTWTLNTLATFNTWSINTVTTLENWVQSNATRIMTWSVNTAASIGAWSLATATSIGNWSIQTAQHLATWATNTLSSVSNWSINTINRIASWSTTTATAFITWTKNTAANISTWAIGVATDITIWATNTGKAIADWAIASARAVYNWGVSAGSNIAAWANGAMDSVAAFSKNTASTVSSWVSGTANGIVSWANGTLHSLASWANGAGDIVSAFGKNAWNTFSDFLSGTANAVAKWGNSLIDMMWSAIHGLMSALSSLAEMVGITLPGNWSSKPTLSNFFSGISGWIGENKSWLAPAAIGAAALGAITVTALTGGAAAPAMIPLLGLETGGIVDKEQIIRVGEKDRREAVVPLENSNYMKPFSAAVANDLFDLMSQGPQYGGGSSDTRPILYVGTLIADDRGLKELERKLQVFRISENQRRGMN